MKDIQVTIDSFKKFTCNIFMVDNIDEISIGGNQKGDCEFESELYTALTLPPGTIDESIDEWDVYLTSIFIGGYKMEQYAQPGCLFENRYRWDGTGSEVSGGPTPGYNALGNINLGTTVTGDMSGGWDTDLSGELRSAAKDKNLATQSLLYNLDSGGDVVGGYLGLNALSGNPGSGFQKHGGIGSISQTVFKNETVQYFIVSINDNKGSYTPTGSFIGAYPQYYETWLANRPVGENNAKFKWDSKDHVDEDFASPNKLTGGLVLMNNQKQRNDGFTSVGGSVNQHQEKVVSRDASGSLTVQDYVPFIYDERENNPIYLTTLKSGDKISNINVKITDQGGFSIWGPAHVSQMENRCGIDANPPTNSRRIIIKLTYKPKIKNRLLEAITKLNDNIEKLIKDDDDNTTKKPLSQRTFISSY